MTLYILENDGSDSSVRTKKTALVYFALTVIAALVAQIYGLFGHGVSSAAMTWMFLYPCLCGMLFYMILGKLPISMKSKKKYRLFFNLYNSGVAALSAGSLLQGILEIAGTKSPYTAVFYIAGASMSLVGLSILLFGSKSGPCPNGKTAFPKNHPGNGDPTHVG